MMEKHAGFPWFSCFPSNGTHSLAHFLSHLLSWSPCWHGCRWAWHTHDQSLVASICQWTFPPMDHLQMLHTAEIQHIPRNWSSSWRILEIGISKFSNSTNISDPKKPVKVSHLVALLASGWAVKPCRRVGRCMTQNISCHAKSAPFYRLYPVVSYVRPAVQFLLQVPFSAAAKWTNLESKFTWLSQRKLQT